MTGAPPEITDRQLIRRRRERSARRSHDAAFLHQRAMEDVVDRLETVKRDFPRALFYGAGGLTNQLTPACGVKQIFESDLAIGRLTRTEITFVADEESAPLAPASLDLIVSMLTLHNVNDLIGALVQARAALKPDGLYIACLFAEDTLKFYRQALYSAETEITGGVTARFLPMSSIQSLGQALTRAGFALPVTDIDRVKVTYENPWRLLQDLRMMGETSPLRERPRALSACVLNRSLELFLTSGAQEQFDIVYLTGWAPHPDQQKPLRPGAAITTLKSAIGLHKD